MEGFLSACHHELVDGSIYLLYVDFAGWLYCRAMFLYACVMYEALY